MDLTRFSPGLKAEAVSGQDFSPAGLLHGESVRVVVVDVGVVVTFYISPPKYRSLLLTFKFRIRHAFVLLISNILALSTPPPPLCCLASRHKYKSTGLHYL